MAKITTTSVPCRTCRAKPGHGLRAKDAREARRRAAAP